MSDSAPITWFTEDPTTIVVSGSLALAVLLVLLFKTGRGIVLLAMAGVALIMALALVIDFLVITDREAIANVIYQVAAAAQRNDLEAAIKCISPTVPEVIADARHWIGRTKLEVVDISAMDVEVDHTTKPQTATAEFRLFARGEIRERGGSIPGNFLDRLWVKFRREGDRWLVVDYSRDR